METETVRIKGLGVRPTTILLVLSLVLMLAAGFTGYGIGVSRERALAGDPTAFSSAGSPDYRALREAWDVVNENFYGDITLSEQADGAVAGMVASLGDRFTTYLPPKEDEAFREDLNGKFGGIGAELETRDGVVTVVAPLAGTPAERAGLLPEDVIVKVNDTSTEDKALDDVVAIIRGDIGTKVTLTIARKNADAPIVLEIIREEIVVKSIKTDTLADGKVGYIRITKFGTDTVDLFRSALKKVAADGNQALIIDLRNNPGGYLQAATATIGMLLPDTIESDNEFLKKRTAVREKSCNYSGSGAQRTCTPKEQNDITSEPAVLPTIPVRVLVNGGSASASEIFAGALRDYNRAKIIGTTTFGKGSVQDLVDLRAGGSVKVTIAHWVTPLGTEINKIGVKPDTEVALAEDTKPSTSDAQVAEALKQLGF